MRGSYTLAHYLSIDWNEPPAKVNSDLFAKILRGAWRAVPPPLDFPPTDLLDHPLDLINSGAGALAWWRICNSFREPPQEFAPFYETYLSQTLSAKVREQVIARVAGTLDAAHIPFMVVKGWAAARLYAEPGLRPMGDLDLVVPPSAQAKAAALLTQEIVQDTFVEVHPGPDDLGYYATQGVSFDALYGRSETVTLPTAHIHIPAREDHLALICLHLMKHGGFRPLWLCDVSAALESLTLHSDWSRIPLIEPYANWISVAIGLAHQMLGAQLGDTPFERSATRLPRWMVPALVRAWQYPSFESQAIKTTPRAGPRLTRSGDILRIWWHEPILATIRRRARFSFIPPYAHQITDWLVTGEPYIRQKIPWLRGT